MIIIGDTYTLTSITSGPPCLLVVSLKTLGHVEVYDVAYVWLIYPHTESDRGYYDLCSLFDKGILILGSLLGIQSCMIGKCLDPIGLKDLGEIHHLGTAHAINDPAFLRIGQYVAYYIPL